MVMTARIAELEKSWLEAEAVADELKHEAARMRASAKESVNGELSVVLARAEELEARHARAEAAASDAFDRLWLARNGGDAVMADAEIRAA